MTKWLSVFGFIAVAASAEPVLVTGGKYTPAILLDESVQSLVMEDFKLDATPVTYAQYLEFVKANPKWQRAHAAAIFHDGNYLISWPGNTEIPKGYAERAVTEVSWFAARSIANSRRVGICIKPVSATATIV